MVKQEIAGLALSVVVIGRNEGQRLLRCIESVGSMSRPFGAIEIIYVDSCSSDGSAGQVAALGAKVVEIKTGKICAARARNAGWQIASAPFILFLDGDTILDSDFPVKAMAEFRNPEVMVVYGTRREINTHLSLYNKVMNLDWIEPAGIKESCGGDAIFRRCCLDETGGFNSELIAGEEPELCRRIIARGGVVSRLDAPMTGHDLGILTFRQYWKRAIRTGHAYAEVSSICRSAAHPFWQAESRKNVVNGLFYVVGFIAAVVASLVWRTWIGLAVFLFVVLARVIRTAYYFQYKSRSPLLLFLYGIHSHAQQIPILLGQLKYWRNARLRWSSEVIEYKA
jgi:cellulose synthase/poly-beta-1,6-N-acetylglucosamine synthase-like glycosyltransferase